MEKALDEILQMFELPASTQNEADGHAFLAFLVNGLLTSKPDRLISILYRMDVSEAKVRETLREKPNEDAGELIAELMIQRQREKIITRNRYKMPDNGDSAEERW